MTLLNQQFGYLKVLALDGYTPEAGYTWKCGCWCGNYTIVIQRDLLRKNKLQAKTCGKCYFRITYEKEYTAWMHAKSRCLNKDNSGYKNYGGRGISMCIEWERDFRKFLLHIGLAPSSKYSLERIDNDKGYEPGNVKWATKTEQLINRRNTLPETRLAYDIQHQLKGNQHENSL